MTKNGHGATMAKKHKHEEHENHERWLVSYADFITLLFAFFVVMYAVSRVDNKKLAQTAASIKWALHYSGNGGVGAPPIFEGPPSEGGCAANTGAGAWTSPQNLQAVETFRKRLEKKIKPFLLDKGAKHVVSIEARQGKLNIRLAAAHFFDPSHAVLRPEALPVLDAVAAELVGLGRPIRVEGHTDQSPAQGTRFRNNWDLSAARAVTVVSYLEQGHKMPADHLAAAGLGSAHPIASNDTSEGREANRRIEMVVELSPSDVMNLAAQ